MWLEDPITKLEKVAHAAWDVATGWRMVGYLSSNQSLWDPHFSAKTWGELLPWFGRKILSGDLKVAAKPLILHGVERLSELAAKYSDQPTVSAVQYSDFHMRNLIFDGTCLTRINISKNEPAPVGHNIVQMLFDYTTFLRSPKEQKKNRSLLLMPLRLFSVAMGLWDPMIWISNFCPMQRF